jgi:membrane-anchored protein YejM (alkaline phosphatase superfamily)
MKLIFRTILIFFLMSGFTLAKSQNPECVILFMIDGMNWKDPDTLKMPALNSLIKEGTYIQKSYVIMPHHPMVGDYSKFNSCSFPNPMLHEGTIFIKPENKFLQEVISPKYQTAFIVNTAAYRSVGRGFTTSIMDPSLTDDQVVAQAIALLKSQNPRFMRIHLQTPGDIGTNISLMEPDKEPYARNIFGKGSPYVRAIENADKLLGEFVTFLKTSGKWNHTVLIVTSDHGQSKIGWHPLFDEDSWVTPLVFAGPGIARGRQLHYFEHTDLAPTIAWLMGVEAPNNDGGAGKVVKEIMQQTDASHYNPSMYIKTINTQIKEFNILRARMILAAENKRYFSNIIASLENTNLTPEPFYHQDRITDWYKSGSTEHLIEANEKILQQMRKELASEK